MRILALVLFTSLVMMASCAKEYRQIDGYDGPVKLLFVNHGPDLIFKNKELKGMIMVEGEKRIIELPQGDLKLRWGYKIISTEKRTRKGRSNILITSQSKTVHIELRCPPRIFDCNYNNLRSIARVSETAFLR